MRRATLLLATTLLGGCISLLPEPAPAPRVFVLEAGSLERASEPGIDAVIEVALPTGDRSALGTDILWRNGDELALVAQTQWSTRAETALQALLVETLTRQGRFRAATRAGEARTDYQIRWEVLDFEISEQTMTARFVADVKLVASSGRVVLRQEIISAESPVSERSASIAAQALARAAREGGARIAEFAANAARSDIGRR